MASRVFFFALTTLLIAGCKVSKLPLETSAAADPASYVKKANDKPFANFHGVLTSQTKVEMEGEGMSLSIEKIDLPPTKNSLNKIKNAYMPAGDIYRLENITFPEPSLILLGGEVLSAQYSTSKLLFEVPAADSTMYAIAVESAFMLEFDRAAELVKDILKNGLPGYVITDNNATVVDFAGRELELGNACSWKAPHHLSCSGLGELQWSLFRTADDANVAMQINMALTEVNSEKVLEKNEKVNLTFEGKPVMATKITYQVLPVQEGASDKFIAYYLTSMVRGHHLYCKVAFYADQALEGKLSPLAAKVISF